MILCAVCGVAPATEETQLPNNGSERTCQQCDEELSRVVLFAEECCRDNWRNEVKDI